MSYNTIEYRIMPVNSYKIMRKCAGCGCKQRFVNTNNFRVNANGNSIDVWLIYQCEKCKHTYNLDIYSRISPKKINQGEYESFLANDMELAYQYGNKKELFAANHAEIAIDDIEYEIKKVDSNDDETNLSDKDVFIIYNPMNLSIRKDKILSEVMNISRSSAKKMLDEERVIVQIEKAQRSN